MDHQVGQDQRSWATHTHSTVYKHLSWKSEKTESEGIQRCFVSMSSLKEPVRVYRRRSELGEWTQQQGKRKVKGQMPAGHWQGLHSILLWSRKSHRFPYSRVSRVQHSGRGWHPAATARACCETWTWHKSHTCATVLPHIIYEFERHLCAHMSPKYRRGHTSSQWRQERGADCSTSSSSGIVGIFLIRLTSSAGCRSHFCSSAGFVSLTFPISVSCGSQLSTGAQFKIGFLSVIPKMKSRGASLRAKLCYSCLHVGRCISQILSVTNRWSISTGPANSHLWKWDCNEVTSMLLLYTSQ